MMYGAGEDHQAYGQPRYLAAAGPASGGPQKQMMPSVSSSQPPQQRGYTPPLQQSQAAGHAGMHGQLGQQQQSAQHQQQVMMARQQHQQAQHMHRSGSGGEAAAWQQQQHHHHPQKQQQQQQQQQHHHQPQPQLRPQHHQIHQQQQLHGPARTPYDATDPYRPQAPVSAGPSAAATASIWGIQQQQQQHKQQKQQQQQAAGAPDDGDTAAKKRRRQSMPKGIRQDQVQRVMLAAHLTPKSPFNARAGELAQHLAPASLALQHQHQQPLQPQQLLQQQQAKPKQSRARAPAVQRPRVAGQAAEGSLPAAPPPAASVTPFLEMRPRAAEKAAGQGDLTGPAKAHTVDDKAKRRRAELELALSEGGVMDYCTRRALEGELRLVKLLDLQRKIKMAVTAATGGRPTPPFPKINRVQGSKLPEPALPVAVPRSDRESVRLRAYNDKLRHLLEGVMIHRERFRKFHDDRAKRLLDLAQRSERHVNDRERRERLKREKMEKQRLVALKANDTGAYLTLLKEHKNDKLIKVLTETDKYLRALGAKVKSEKVTTRRKAGGNEGDDGGDDAVEQEEAFQRTDIRNTDEVDITALMHNKTTYYEIAHTDKECVVAQPDMLKGGTLRQYQLQGLQWLVSLYNNSLSGILADEMGLGKTIQVVALIAYLMENKASRGPFLVVAPLSTIGNWQIEFDRWTPNVSRIDYQGNKQARKKLQQRALAREFNVTLTTYEYVMRDVSFFSKINWEYNIVDEGHRMKNAESKFSQILAQKVPSRFRLLITGTPLQNNLNELWSLLNFLLPHIFQNDSSFEHWFNAGSIMGATGDSVDMDEEEKLLIIDRLHQVLRPFMLRRLKKEVEGELKAKVEMVIKCALSATQRKLYNEVRNKGVLSLKPGEGAKRTARNIMMELRKVCNHPYLFWLLDRPEEPSAEIVRSSGKFELLSRMLPKLRASGHKVLIFNQMTRLMDIMGDFLTRMGHRYLRLDGTTDPQRRSELIEIFNQPESPFACFILSTRAGGLGLNLPAADTVVIFDSDWNPMMDLQAQDRAHRIGQTREVRVYRLIGSDTLEEDIQLRANRKLDLGGAAIDGGMFNEKSTVEDRHEFIKNILQRTASMGRKDVPTHAELNGKIGRNEVERDLFERMDAEARDTDRRNGAPEASLMTEQELPSWLTYVDAEEGKSRSKMKGSVEKASRKSRKRKTATYKEDEVSHSSDMDSSDDDEGVGKGTKGKSPGKGRRGAGKGNLGSDSEGDEEGGGGSSRAASGGGKGGKKASGAAAAGGWGGAGGSLPEEEEDPNKDHCEVCGYGGELVCCDFCPCAFHEVCLMGITVPPPPATWRCPSCVGSLEKLIDAYLVRNPMGAVIQDADFCDLCGGKEDFGPLAHCTRCEHRSFHFTCAGILEGADVRRWVCPECDGTAGEVFRWEKIVPYPPEKEEGEDLFVEIAPSGGGGGGGGKAQEAQPASKGKKGGEKDKDKERGGAKPSDGKHSEEPPAKKRGPGRPPKAGNPPTDGGGRGKETPTKAKDVGVKDKEGRGKRAERGSPSMGGDEEEEEVARGSRRRKRVLEDDD